MRTASIKLSQLKYFENNKRAIYDQINKRRKINYDDTQKHMRKQIYYEVDGKYRYYRKLFNESFR